MFRRSCSCRGMAYRRPDLRRSSRITASGVIVGSSINAWLINRHVSAKAMFDVALMLECLSALVLLTVGLAGAGSAIVDAVLVMVFISAFGLVFPNAVHEAIHPLPEIAGLASAVVTTTQMLFGAIGGVAAAALYHDASPTALGAIMSAAALAGRRPLHLLPAGQGRVVRLSLRAALSPKKTEKVAHRRKSVRRYPGNSSFRD